jgi:hypothetical protein
MLQQSRKLLAPALMCSLCMENYFGVGNTNNYNTKTLPVKSDKHTYLIITVIFYFMKKVEI